MSKQKNYFVNYRKIETGEISRGLLIQAKCERSALFTLGLTYNTKDWEVNRVAEISDKVYNRLKSLDDFRRKKEHQAWLASGGKERAMSTLGTLAAFNAMIDGPYGRNGF